MEKQKLIEQAIQAIADAHGGKVTPEMVVQAAQDPESPLHDQFDWDNESAAHKHRLDTGRRLIRGVKVVIKRKTTVFSAPGFVRDPDSPKKEQGYVDTRKLKNDEERQRDVLIDEFTRVQAVFKRSRNLALMFQMEHRLDDMQQRLDIMIAELGGTAGHA